MPSEPERATPQPASSFLGQLEQAIPEAELQSYLSGWSQDKMQLEALDASLMECCAEAVGFNTRTYKALSNIKEFAKQSYAKGNIWNFQTRLAANSSF